jgi:hypothetical protein
LSGCCAEGRLPIMSFDSVIDTSFLGDFDIKTLQREEEIDELEIQLMNYIRDTDYCEAVKRRRP